MCEIRLIKFIIIYVVLCEVYCNGDSDIHKMVARSPTADDGSIRNDNLQLNVFVCKSFALTACQRRTYLKTVR